MARGLSGASYGQYREVDVGSPPTRAFHDAVRKLEPAFKAAVAALPQDQHHNHTIESGKGRRNLLEAFMQADLVKHTRKNPLLSVIRKQNPALEEKLQIFEAIAVLPADKQPRTFPKTPEQQHELLVLLVKHHAFGTITSNPAMKKVVINAAMRPDHLAFNQLVLTEHTKWQRARSRQRRQSQPALTE